MNTNELTRAKNTKIFSHLKIIGLCLLISIFVLAICSCNSFLYKFNDWCDLNWYITIGNGMLNGQVPYKDLFDHKGPLLYLVFAVVCLFKNPYIATYVLECICFTFYLYFAYRISRYRLSVGTSIFVVITLGVLTGISAYFEVGGGAVEEYFLPIIMYLLLCVVEFVSINVQFTIKRSLAIGACLATIFWTKFTVLIIPAILLIFWLVVSLRNKEWKIVLKSISFMLLSFAILSFLILLYYLFNHAIKDVFEVYFYFNLFKYNSGFNHPSEIFVRYVKDPITLLLILVGIIYTFKLKQKKLSVLIIICFVVLFLSFFKIQCYIYYLIPLTAFSLWGIMCVYELIEKKITKFSAKQVLSTVAVVLAVVVCILGGNGTIEMKRSKNDYVQYQVANTIRSYNMENPSLMCYKMLDYGFYNASNISPNQYYFALSNFTYKELPEMYDIFDESIKNGSVDFVVVFKSDYENNTEFFHTHYAKVDDYSYKYIDNSNKKSQFTVVLLKHI